MTTHSLVVSLLVLAAPLTAAPADLPSELPAIAARCAGPTAAMLPECQALRNAAKTRTPAPQSAPSEPVRTPAPAPRGEPERPPASVPPESTEFQRLAASTTGELLPIFGASLFDQVPTTFAPLDRVPVSADYAVGPGDELLIRVWGQVTLNLATTVDRSGAIYIPDVGNVTVAGLRFEQLPGYLKSQLSRVFRNFELSVNMGELRSVQIFVVGHARRPGTYTVSSLSTLVNALFASGGPSARGSMRRIQLKRGPQVVTEFDLYELLLQGDKTKDAHLLPGDVVYIPAVGRQVAVAGSVRTPAVYELKNEHSIGELLALCGGPAATADTRVGFVERVNGRGSREVLEVPLEGTGPAAPIRDGDVLRIRPVLPRFENAVTLRGNVANPGRFAWRTGMRLRDIVPDKEALVTRDYYKKRNLLGYVAPLDMHAAAPADEKRHKAQQTEIGESIADINWSYAVIERQNRQTLNTELVAFHPGKLLQDADDTQNLELQPGDVVTIFSQSDFRVPVAQQNRYVRLEGEFNSAGVYQARPGETLGQLIQRAGGLTPHAYPFGSQFIRQSTRREQQLRLEQFVGELEREIDRTAATRLAAAATPEEASNLNVRLESERKVLDRMKSVEPTGRIVLRLDPSNPDLAKLMDLTLEDGDTFTVPSRPGTVHVFGAVFNQNSFIHEPGLGIKEYIRQAGGAMRNADKSHIFVIRADGSVVPKKDGGVKDFDHLRLSPGDSIVVPDAVLKGSFMKSIRDWSQIFAQFGLGAAAINVLR